MANANNYASWKTATESLVDFGAIISNIAQIVMISQDGLDQGWETTRVAFLGTCIVLEVLLLLLVLAYQAPTNINNVRAGTDQDSRVQKWNKVATVLAGLIVVFNMITTTSLAAPNQVGNSTSVST